MGVVRCSLRLGAFRVWKLALGCFQTGEQDDQDR